MRIIKFATEKKTPQQDSNRGPLGRILRSEQSSTELAGPGPGGSLTCGYIKIWKYINTNFKLIIYLLNWQLIITELKNRNYLAQSYKPSLSQLVPGSHFILFPHGHKKTRSRLQFIVLPFNYSGCPKSGQVSVFRQLGCIRFSDAALSNCPKSGLAILDHIQK